MKKILLMAFLLFISSVIEAQNKISFSEINSSSLDSSNFSRTLGKYKILEIHENVQTIVDGETLTLEYLKAYPFVLKENKLLAKDYSVGIKDENRVDSKSIYDLGFDGHYYSNINATASHQMALSIFESQYSFFVKDKDHAFYIEPLIKFDKKASLNYYIYYEVQDILNSGINCPVVDEQEKPISDRIVKVDKQPNDNCKTVELNFCVDYSFYATYATVNQVINRTLEILNLTQLDYSIANGLAYDVRFKVKRHYIITCSQCNFWTTTGDISTNYINFFSETNYSQMFNEASDIRVFWQADIGPIDYNGVATQSGTFIDCISSPVVTVKQACVKNFMGSNGSYKTRGVLSHELGHTLSCPHEGISSTIMGAVGGSLTDVWHPNSIAIINNSLTLSNCYYDCIEEQCYDKHVEDVVLNINSLDNMFELNWLSEVGMEYKIRLFSYASNSWSDYTTVSYPSNTITFSYDPQSASCKYRIEIIPVCSGANGNAHVLMFKVIQFPSVELSFLSTAQDEVLCRGLTYTFEVTALNPGSNPVYEWRINGIVRGNNPSFTTSILYNQDILDCSITNTEYCATSQYSIVSKTVTVEPQPCGTLSNTSFENKELEYFPNPVEGEFTIKSLSNIKSISLYNLFGQKIFEDSINNMSAILDFSRFPVATYLLKIELKDHFKTIKISRK